MQKFVFTLLVTSILALWTGCNKTVGSTDIATAEMYALLNARAEDSGETTIEARIKKSKLGSTYIEFSGDDHLNISYGGTTEEMEKTEGLLGNFWYSKSYETVTGDSEFVISLERSRDDGAPESILTLPMPFQISSPEADSRFVPGINDIVIVWSDYGSDDLMNISLHGDCVYPVNRTTDDQSGMYTIYADEIRVPEDFNEECTVHIKLERERPGLVDSHFGLGGEASVKQVRSVDVLFVP